MQRFSPTATFDTPFPAAPAVERRPIAPFQRPQRAFGQHLSRADPSATQAHFLFRAVGAREKESSLKNGAAFSTHCVFAAASASFSRVRAILRMFDKS